MLVRGQVYGNLYLTEKRDGDFTAEDFTWILRRPIPVDEQEEQSLSLTEGVALYETPRIPVRPVSVL